MLKGVALNFNAAAAALLDQSLLSFLLIPLRLIAHE
jgi:hypothetical protein